MNAIAGTFEELRRPSATRDTVARESLQVRKKVFHPGKAVKDAQEWAAELVHHESRGNGDTENAMRRLETSYGIPWRTFWNLRYRPPVSIDGDILVALYAARRSMQERLMRKLKHDLEITKRTAGPDAPSVAAVQAVVGSDEGEI